MSKSLDPAPDSRMEPEVYGGDFNSLFQTTEPITVLFTDQPSSGGDVQTSETSTPATSMMTRQSVLERRPPQRYRRPIVLLRVEECSRLIFI